MKDGGYSFPSTSRGFQRPQPKCDETVHYLCVSLEELYLGKTRTIKVKKKIICAECNGRGGKSDASTKTCTKCHGAGRLSYEVLPGLASRILKTCDLCSGKGRICKDPCEACNGERTVAKTVAVRVNVEKGMRDGQEILMEQAGDQHPECLPGDLIVVLAQKQHKIFR